MRKVKFLLLACIATYAITSCSQKDEFLPVEESIPIASENVSISQLAVHNNVSFDWEATDRISLFNVMQPVILPWYNAAEGQIPSFIVEDYKKSDGWEMVYNFCTDPNEYQDGKYYLMFYNKLSGILRVFYYCKYAPSGGSTTFWQVRLDSPSSTLNTAGHFTAPSNVRPIGPMNYVSNISTTHSKSLSLGWNCFDVELCYDPTSAGQRQLFSIGLYEQTVASILLTGSVSLNSEGTIVSTSTSENSTKKMADGAAKQVGKAAGNKITELLTSGKVLPLIAGGVGAIVSGGVGAIIGAGINLIFGSFMGKPKETKTVQDLNFKTTGSVDLSGTMTVISQSVGVPVQNLLMPGSTPNAIDRLAPIYNKTLGAWNITNAPVIVVDRPAQLVGDDQGMNVYWQDMHIDYNSVNVVINPETMSLLNRYEVAYEIVYYDKLDGNKNWNGDSYSDWGIIKGQLIYKDDKNEFYRYPQLGFSSYVPPTYNPPLDPTVRSCMPHYMTDGRVKHNFVVKVTVTMYPKAPYDTTPITMTRTYLPNYTTMNSALDCVP